ncbi:hypothetical protein ACQYWQ_11945 [Streptomyces sp. P6-2-1]|uniref:hypothetical protein n=1 Tax=unclassified Streptomyces TaxID=2593676 RepID=UPI003D35C4F0
MPTLLYYPLVNPPAAVLHQGLLYWDALASIVPSDPGTAAHAVTDELRELADRGLYHPLTLSERLTEPLRDHRDFVMLCEDLVALARTPHGPVTEPMDAGLFATKVGVALERRIVRSGLGRAVGPSPDPRRPRYSVLVSREVRQLLVGALAHQIARTDETRAYTPYTEHEGAHESAVRSGGRGQGVGAWRVQLGRLLPTPAPGTPTARVLAFREKYADERERLMGATQTLLRRLRQDWEHPADVLRRIEPELRQAREDYHAAARASRTAWVSRSLSATVAVAGTAAGALLLPGLEWLASIAGNIGFNIATREVRPLRQHAEHHPYAYLSRVESELG